MRFSLLIGCFLALFAAVAAAEDKPAPAVVPAPAIAPAATPAATPSAVAAVAAADAFATVTIENKVARVVISTQRAAIDSFELLDSHPTVLPGPLRKQSGIDKPTTDERTEPLAVLGPFRTTDSAKIRAGHNRHNWLSGYGLLGSAGQPWTVVSHTGDGAVLRLTLPDKGLEYRLTYAMHATRPTVSTTLVVRNLGTAEQTLVPTLVPLNGIHQDYPAGEAIYLTAFAHSGGAQGSLTTVAFPKPGKDEELGIELGSNADFVGLKSRFFAAWWTPGSLTIDSATPASAPAAVEGPTAGAAATTAIPVAGKWAARVYTYPASYPNAQAFVQVAYDAVKLKPGEQLTHSWLITAACMKSHDLALLDDSERKVEFTDGYYKFFRLLAQILTYVLNLIALVVRNYGVAVLVLTVLLKLALHRTTFKQQASMLKMQKLQPELKYIQEQYKNDRTKLGAKQMELFKKHGVSPLGGCLPMFLQVPIFIALYQSFSHSADMRGQGFLWVSDLTLPDQLLYLGFHVPVFDVPATINPLPLVYLAVTIYMSFTQKPPTTGDETQVQMAKTMRWLPAIFGVIFYNLPAGLVLYFCANSIITSIEMRMVKRKLGMP